MTVYKTPMADPNPQHTSEMWISYVSPAELTSEFANFCVTYPVAHWDSNMSQIVTVYNIYTFYSTVVTRLKVPH